MGLFEKLRAEIVDVVEWLDDERHTLVWRFPRYHSQIKNGAKLIVRPGQIAILVHQGKIADVFEPGTHTLVTRNLPVLSTIAAWPYGFDSPFKADVYFIATRQVTDLKWGTPHPVVLRDPTYGPIRVRAFGTFSLKATDPRALITELVGTDSRVETEEIGELLRSAICACFADLIATSQINVVDLAANYTKLSDKLRAMIVERIGTEFGLDVPQFYIVNISMPQEVEQALDARTSASVLGDLLQFQQYQLGKSIPEAAANPAGGLAGAGVGVGMGLAIAKGFPTASPVPPVPPTNWFYAEGSRPVGPVTRDQLAESVAAGRVSPTTLTWTEGMPTWAPAGSVPALNSLFTTAPPPLPR